MAPCPLPLRTPTAQRKFSTLRYDFVAVSERHRLLTCIEKGLGGRTHGGPPCVLYCIQHIISIEKAISIFIDLLQIIH